MITIAVVRRSVVIATAAVARSAVVWQVVPGPVVLVEQLPFGAATVVLVFLKVIILGVVPALVIDHLDLLRAAPVEVLVVKRTLAILTTLIVNLAIHARLAAIPTVN